MAVVVKGKVKFVIPAGRRGITNNLGGEFKKEFTQEAVKEYARQSRSRRYFLKSLSSKE